MRGVRKPAYECVTAYLRQLEMPSSKEVESVLYREFMPACYEPDITDHHYDRTLEESGLPGVLAWAANVESLDLKTTVALLTFILRADHFVEGSLAQSLNSGYLTRVLRRLAELDGTWERPNVVTFYREYEKDGYLSNWYEAPFEFGGITFPTGEHWMMWHKAHLFRDWDTADRILEATSLDEVKNLGRQVKPYSDVAWDEVRVPVMRVGLRHKFAQNECLANDLLSTGSAVLAEAAPKDRTWGVGIAKGDPKLDDPLSWRGRNLLGITLMNVRSDLRAIAARGLRMEWSVDILQRSHVWCMSLLELARIPSTRPAALMYAQMVNQSASDAFQGTKSVLRKIDGSIGDINEQMALNMGCGLPIVGWGELLDELAFQIRAGMV
ncbi:MAG: NADAR domain-containing protein [Coriobacteriales bacterium]|nr:NADAR domain-containing protein [Coriobacteriales bacterium]